MKKGIITSLTCLGFFLFLNSNSKAQETALLSPKDLHAKSRISLQAYKPDLFTVSSALPLNAVSSKAIRTFKSSFKNVSDQQWFFADKAKFLTTFITKDGKQARALLDQNGYLYYGIIYEDEQSLSKEQRKAVKSKYFDYNIRFACEVISEYTRAWIFTLDDEDNVLKIRLNEDGSIDELEHYCKRPKIK